MNKYKLYITLFSLVFLPANVLAATVTTNVNNVPLQVQRNNSQVIDLIPNATTITKNSSNGEWYEVTYGEKSGWINRVYTREGFAEKMAEQAAAQSSSSNSSGNSSSSNNSSNSNNSNNSNTGYNGNASSSSTSQKMQRIVAAANKYGKQYDLNPYLILALIKVESSFNPNARSNANCRGLMQISYKYASSWGIDKSRLYEIEYNIYHGTRLLKTNFIKGMGGSVYDGLRAYNQGINGAKKSSSNGKSYADKIMKYYNTYKTKGFSY